MTLHLPDDMVAAVSLAARTRGQDANSLLAELVGESLKLRQVPGITFADGPAGRRARVEGTGIDVFEIVQTYIAEEGDRTQLATAYHWLDERQLEAALEYYRLFPDDVTPFLSNGDGSFGAAIE